MQHARDVTRMLAFCDVSATEYLDRSTRVYCCRIAARPSTQPSSAGPSVGRSTNRRHTKRVAFKLFSADSEKAAGHPSKASSFTETGGQATGKGRPTTESCQLRQDI